jgi:hypothetical protein
MAIRARLPYEEKVESTSFIANLNIKQPTPKRIAINEIKFNRRTSALPIA